MKSPSFSRGAEKSRGISLRAYCAIQLRHRNVRNFNRLHTPSVGLVVETFCLDGASFSGEIEKTSGGIDTNCVAVERKSLAIASAPRAVARSVLDLETFPRKIERHVLTPEHSALGIDTAYAPGVPLAHLLAGDDPHMGRHGPTGQAYEC